MKIGKKHKYDYPRYPNPFPSLHTGQGVGLENAGAFMAVAADEDV